MITGIHLIQIKLFPLRLMIVPEGAFVEHSFSDESIPPVPVVAYHGQPMEEIINTLLLNVTFGRRHDAVFKIFGIAYYFWRLHAAFSKSKPVYAVHF